MSGHGFHLHGPHDPGFGPAAIKKTDVSRPWNRSGPAPVRLAGAGLALGLAALMHA